MKPFVALAVIAFALGCATVGSRHDPESLSRIKERETTRPQVIEYLGSPATTTLDGEGREILSYNYSKVTPSAQNFIPIMGIIQSKMEMETQIVQILLSKEGIVQKVTSSNSTSTIKSGLVTE